MHTLPSRLPAPAAHQSNKPCHHFFDVPPSHTHAHTPTSPPRLSSRQTKRVSVKLRGTATHTYQTFVESLYIPPIHPPLCARQAPLCSQSHQSLNSSTQRFPSQHHKHIVKSFINQNKHQPNQTIHHARLRSPLLPVQDPPGHQLLLLPLPPQPVRRVRLNENDLLLR